MNNLAQIVIVLFELIGEIYYQVRKTFLKDGKIPSTFLNKGKKEAFQTYDTITVTTLNTTYDYQSLMHYEKHAFSQNGQPTIEPRQAGMTIGQRNTMSTTDIQEVRSFYKCK